MRAFFVLVLLLLGVLPALSDDDPKSNRIMFFGGTMMSGTFPGWTLIPYAGRPENNHIVGLAYERTLARLPYGFEVGAEAGAAVRFGFRERTSGEFWGGFSARHDGVELGQVRISPGIVLGLSAVTAPIGIEAQRAQGGDPSLLFYLGPELAFSHRSIPNAELVLRTHHRSGLMGFLGNMREGHNANIVALRFRY